MLDLLVGGYSNWNPERKQLTAAEKKAADELEKRMEALRAELQQRYQDVLEKARGDEAALKKLY
jgi:hypothetical protein